MKLTALAKHKYKEQGQTDWLSVLKNSHAYLHAFFEIILTYVM